MYCKVLRTSKMFMKDTELIQFDGAIRQALESITNVSLEGPTWEQASLPIRMGGLGIIAPSKLASSAFISSVCNSSVLAEQIYHHDAETTLVEASAVWDTLVKPNVPSKSKSQRDIFERVAENQFEQLMNASSEKDVSRLQGASCKGAGDWLNAMPSRTLCLHMPDEKFRIAVSMRLGAPVCSEHTCTCGAKVDSDALHAFTCNHSKSRHARHNMGNNIILKALQAAQVPSELEPKSLFVDGKRPDGLTQVPWARGKCLAWDFTCVHRLASSYMNCSTQEGPTAAAVAESRKTKKYSAIAVSHIFQPIAVETLGGLGPETVTFVHSLGSRITAITGERRATEFLRQRLSIAVQLGNASAVLETFIKEEDPLKLDLLLG